MTDDSPRVRSWAPWLLAAVITAVTWPRFFNGLAWDDPFILHALRGLAQRDQLLNVLNHSTVSIVLGRDQAAGAIDLYRPLSLLSLAGIEALFGPAPLWQHTCNLVLHLACVALVYVLAQRRPFALPCRWAAFAAAWFGLMPSLGEAHLWISGRFDLLATLLVLLSVLLHATTSRSLLRACAAGLAFLGALASKESTVLVAPALLFMPRAVSLHERLRTLLPFGFAIAIYSAARLLALGWPHGPSPDLGAVAQHAGPFVLDALHSAVLPSPQYVRAPIEDYQALGPARQLVLTVSCAGVCALAWSLRRRQPALSWSWLWFVLCLAPAIAVTTMHWTGFGRYLYLPASLFVPGVVVALHAGLQRVPRITPSLCKAAAGVYLGTCALLLNLFAHDWRDSETIYTAILHAAPQRSHGWGYLGLAALEQRRYPEAADLLRRAHAIAPGEPRYVPPLVRALLFTGHTREARAAADAAIARWPAKSQYRLLAAHARVRDDPDEAIEFILQCLRLDRSNQECRDALLFLSKRDPRHAQIGPKIARSIEAEGDPHLRAELGRLVSSGRSPNDHGPEP